MKARRQIVDLLTGAPVPIDSPVAVDTGNVVVGRDTVVPQADLDPARDRFGIDPSAAPRLRAEVEEAKALREARTPHVRGPAIKTTMESPEAGVKEFIGMNPELEHAMGEPDVASDTREFMDSIDVRSGKKFVKLSKAPAGRRILAGGGSESVAIKMLKYLFAQARGRRWREVPWTSVYSYVGTLAPDAPIAAPIAAGLDPPDVQVQRIRDELPHAKAVKAIRDMKADELRSLADRMESAIDRNGEDCLTGDAEKAARARVAIVRKWSRDPSLVPEWSCVGSEESMGDTCTFPAILEDIQRLENACAVDYDPRWPLERAEKACEDGEHPERTGIIGEPCTVSATAKGQKRLVRIGSRTFWV
jgi:hypothetical protein